MLLGQGQNVSGGCKQLGVSEQTYDRWRKTYGGMKVGPGKAALTRSMVGLATQYGRYGYRRVPALLQAPRLAGQPWSG